MSYDLDLLRKMIVDSESAPDLYQPTHCWQHIIPAIMADLEKGGMVNFRAHKSALNYYVPTYPDGQPGIKKAKADYLLCKAMDIFSPPKWDQVSESCFGTPTQRFVFDDKSYSRSFLNYLKGLVYLKLQVDTNSVKRVLEFGGGFGSLGEIFLKSDPERFFYVNVDIPPLAFIATRYLQKVFGEENVATYDITGDMDSIDLDFLCRNYKAAVLCPWQLPRLVGQFDLFVNFFSFQEMEPEIVENYALHVNRLVRRYILLRNQRKGKQIATKVGDFGVIQPVTREHYVRFFSPFALLAVDSLTFGEVKNGHASEVLVFERRPQI